MTHVFSSATTRRSAMNHSTFTVTHWCVLLMALMPIVCAGIAKFGRFSVPRREGGYDNHNPRTWLAEQSNWRARANAAQHNTFEALPFFFAAVLIAEHLQALQFRLDLLAVMFVFLRIVYVALYVGDLPKLRSSVWALALAVNVGILFLGYR
jgi:uncharacterized MAPEG superfamily protein